MNLSALLAGDKTIAGWPIGSPAVIMKMLQSSTRHETKAVTEDFPMSDVNDAMTHLREGKARYRIVLRNNIN